MPVRPFGSAAGTGLPQSPPLPRFRPVASRTGQLIRLLSPSPLPSRSFSSLGIKAFNGRHRRPVRLPIPPDFRSLPATVLFLEEGYGSSFTVRYVIGGLLFLKPLGTFITMLL